MVLQLRQKHLSWWLWRHLELGAGVWGDGMPCGAWRRQMGPGFGHGSQDMGTWRSQDLGRISEAIIVVTSLGRALTPNAGVSM